MQGSKICEFYKDKNILLTGATGFLGKLLIEKLLRVCQPKAIYTIIRTKKSIDPQIRLNEMFQYPVFDKMKESITDYKERVILVQGDMAEEGLGLAESDRKVLCDTINIVFHVAATVKFDETLTLATNINIKGTMSILKLCREISNLESVVHVSTAFSNCHTGKIEEDFYEVPISSGNLIKLTECLDEAYVQKISPYIIGKWPNTYTFTKAVAEDAVKTYSRGLPIAIFRPAIVVSTKEEPVPGWIDNVYGPIGIMVGYGSGVIRVLHNDPQCNAELVPADSVINCLLAIGYKTALCPSGLDVPIYNFATNKDNRLKWNDFMKISSQRGYEIPSAQALWFYTITCIKNPILYFILSLLCHTIPALLVDAVLLIMNKKRRAFKIYKKIHKFTNVIAYFSLRNWEFSSDNVNSLWLTLNESDKALFNFNMSSINWETYLRDSVTGLRKYMFKEKEDTVSYGKKKQLLFWVLHRTVQAVFFTSIGWFLWRLISPLATLV